MKTDEQKKKKGFKEIYSFVLGQIHSLPGLRAGELETPVPKDSQETCN